MALFLQCSEECGVCINRMSYCSISVGRIDKQISGIGNEEKSFRELVAVEQTRKWKVVASVVYEEMSQEKKNENKLV